MIFKEIRQAGYDISPNIWPLDLHDYSLIKQSAEMHPAIDAYIKKVKPIPGKSILMLDAMGSSEYWGCNINGDWFPEHELRHPGKDYGYETFMEHAYPYMHHMNEGRKKDPSRRYGDKVNLSVYFEPMHRIQLIITVDKNKCQDVLSRIDQGNYPDVSMACNVAYDQCSRCERIHKTRADYCDHAIRMLKDIEDDGQQTYLINHRPKFHDISFVIIGAEPAAKVLMKVAGVLMPIDYQVSAFKNASIEKEISSQVMDAEEILPPAEDLEELSATMGELQKREEDFPYHILKMLGKYPLKDTIKTLSDMAIILRPKEFQTLVLEHTGDSERATEYHKQNVCFDPTNTQDAEIPDGEFDQGILSIVAPMLQKRSGMTPFVLSRMEKTSMIATPAVTSLMWPALAGLYQAYNKKLPSSMVNVIEKGMNRAMPYLGPVVTVQAWRMASQIGEHIGENMNKNESIQPDNSWFLTKSSAAPLIWGIGSIPLTYMYSGIQRRKAAAGQRDLNWLDRFVAKRPEIASVISVMTIPRIVKSLQKMSGGLEKNIVRYLNLRWRSR